MKQRSPTFNGDYQRPMTPKRHTQTWRIPEWLAASGLTIGKQSTSFDFARACQHKDSLKTSKGKARQQRPRNHQKASPLVSQASRITGLINSTWDNPVNHRRGLLERQANWIAQASFQPLTTLEKEGSTRKARDSNPLFNLSHPTQSKELTQTPYKAPFPNRKSDPSSSFQSSLLTVGNLASLVQMCPFAQKGWVEVSTISRFHCCLIIFVQLTCFF